MKNLFIQWEIPYNQLRLITEDIINMEEIFLSTYDENNFSLIIFKMVALDSYMINCLTKYTKRENLIRDDSQRDLIFPEDRLTLNLDDFIKSLENYKINDVKTDKNLFIEKRSIFLKLLSQILGSNNKIHREKAVILLYESLNFSQNLLNSFILDLPIIKLTKPKKNYSTLITSKTVIFSEIFHPDLIKTFINAVEQSGSKIMFISNKLSDFGFIFWLRGNTTYIIEKNSDALQDLLVLNKLKYDLLTSSNLFIYDPVPNNKRLGNLYLVLDKSKTLHRIKDTVQEYFNGVILYNCFKNLKNSEIYSFLDKILKLLKPGGYLLIHDNLKSLEKGEVNKKERETELKRLEKFMENHSLMLLLRMNQFGFRDFADYLYKKH